jgi:F-type H+-transporting ATPase subunit b
MIDSRQKEIDDMYSGAEESKKAADELRAEYEEKISHAAEESEEILKNAVRRAQLKEEEILREADVKAARTLERAEEQIELEKRRAINEVKNEVSSMAIEIASAVIERDVSADEHKKLIDEFISNMGNES